MGNYKRRKEPKTKEHRSFHGSPQRQPNTAITLLFTTRRRTQQQNNRDHKEKKNHIKLPS